MALSFAKDIRPMFTDMDVAHMKNMGMDLSHKADVAASADDIYAVVSNGSMPPPNTGERWTPDMCAHFKQWQTDGCPP